MRSVYFACITSLASLTQTAFSAGVGSSGGGKAVVCRADDQQITSATLLDLYEAEKVWGLELPPAVGDIEEEYGQVVRTLRWINHEDPVYTDNDRAFFHHNLENFIYFVPEAESIPDIDDTGELPELAQGCQFEQAAYVKLFGEHTYVNREIWNAFDEKNRAALMFHELLYSRYLRFQETHSRNVRKIVAHVFSRDAVKQLRIDLPEQYYECRSGKYYADPEASHFFAYTTPNGSTVLRFQQLAGRETYWPVEAEFPTIIDFENAKLIANGDTTRYIFNQYSSSFSGTAMIRNGLFEEYKVTIKYQPFKSLSVALLSLEGRPLQQNDTLFCVSRQGD